MSDTARVCPYCDAADVRTRRPDDPNSNGSVIASDEQYRCDQCLRLFDEPERRELKGHGEGGSALAAKLQNAAPDELP